MHINRRQMQTSSAAYFLLSCCIVWCMNLLFGKACMRNNFINKLGIWCYPIYMRMFLP